MENYKKYKKDGYDYVLVEGRTYIEAVAIEQKLKEIEKLSKLVKGEYYDILANRL